MRGIPEFNFPQFYSAAAWLRGEGYDVFSPAERDNEKHGVDISKGNVSGSEDEATTKHGFSLCEALAADTQWICKHGEGLALLPGWHNSKGAKAECALALAIGLPVYYLHEMPSGEWFLTLAEDL